MLHIVYNPAAAKGKAERALKKVHAKLRAAGIEYRIYKSEREKHAISLTRDIISGGADNVIAMGGDGTISEVLNGFSDFENVTLGIIPCGSGNDFVRSANIPLDTDKALDIILKGKASIPILCS